MYADTADYSEWKTGRRATGLVFSASSMSQKFGWTLGGAFTGWLLAYYGFQANVAQSGNTQTAIRMMVSILPAIGALISGAFMLIYPLKESQLATIETELAARRAAQPETIP
jgi:GPH family glycoside/pentoside/hexuronide:cation symporter